MPIFVHNVINENDHRSVETVKCGTCGAPDRPINRECRYCKSFIPSNKVIAGTDSGYCHNFYSHLPY